MPSTQKRRVLSSLLEVMYPMARLMLRNGIDYKQFSAVCKQAFVDVSTHDFGIRGRPTNVSRVAVMTGLTRKEVKKVREQGLSTIEEISASLSPQAEILHYWHTDKDFIDSDGHPRVLPFDGPGNTFSHLSKTYAGDIPPGAMRTELKRVGAISENKDGSLIVHRRDFVPVDPNDRLIEGLGSSVKNLLSTVAFNSSVEKVDETRFEKNIYSVRVNKNKLNDLKQSLFAKLLEVAIDIDDHLSVYDVPIDDDTSRFEGEVGVGIYYFERKS